MRAFPPPYRPISHLNVVSTRAYALVIAPALIVFRFSRNYFVLFFFFFFSTSLERIIRFVWKISRPSCRFCLFGSQLVRGFITHGIATRLRKSRLSDCVIQRREKKKPTRYLLRSIVSNDAIGAPGGHSLRKLYYPTINNEMSRVKRLPGNRINFPRNLRAIFDEFDDRRSSTPPRRFREFPLD